MKLAIVSFSIITIGLYATAQQGQTPLQSKPVALTAASISDLKQRAEAGNAQAQFDLARAYEDGNGVAQDDAKAVEWFRRSAEQDNAQAQNSLGVMYALGRGVNRDREEAVRWYRKAAKSGLPDAMYNVAISYYNGEGVEGNISQACSWMMAAQRKGDAQAGEALKHIQQEVNNRVDRCKFDLAGLYEKGEEIEQDLPAAAALYTEAAQQDRKQNLFADTAQYKLCQLYVAGKGVPQDYAQAKFWCKKSQVGFAYIVLGRMAEKGLGGNKDLNEAMGFYREAAARGVPDGFMDAGRLRLESGTHQGQKQAYFWYAIAAKRNYSGAAEKLREVVAHLSENEVADESGHVNNWLKAPRKAQEEMQKH